VGFSLRFAPQAKLMTIFDGYPDGISLFMEKWLASWGYPAEEYKAYRQAIGNIHEATRTLARGGRYMNTGRMSVEDVRAVLQATDRLARALVARSG
jgi:hypothetical protein